MSESEEQIRCARVVEPTRIWLQVRRPELARDLLGQMQQLGIEPAEEQLAIPEKIERDRQPKLRYPPTPAISYSKTRGGFFHPKPSAKTVEKWTLPRGSRTKQKRIMEAMRATPRALPEPRSKATESKAKGGRHSRSHGRTESGATGGGQGGGGGKVASTRTLNASVSSRVDNDENEK